MSVNKCVCDYMLHLCVCVCKIYKVGGVIKRMIYGVLRKSIDMSVTVTE